MLAHAALALSIVVRVYDMHGVPPDTLVTARAVTTNVLKDAGIAVRWAECPCTTPAGPLELIIRVASATPDSDPASLGFSYVDVGQKAGTLATVFADRVRSLAESARTSEGELLGRAMAHEIGHLLLGTRDHNAVGLMRGRWTSIELASNRPIDWTLARSDSDKLRRALVRRMRGASAPAAVVADARPAVPAFSAP